MEWPAKAETFFYKDGKTGPESLTEEEHEVIYTIKLIFQFPMNLAHSNGSPYNPDEIKTMNDEIHKIYPNIHAVFIPTTMYEFFVLHNIDNLEKEHPGCFDRPYSRYMGKDATSCQFYNIELKKLHGTINNHIISELAEKNISQLTQHDYEVILQQKVYLLETSFLNNAFTDNILKRAITLEYNAQENGNFLLYRGTNRLPPSYLFTADNDEQYSFSFGSSLFGGYFYDSGACAYKLFKDYKSGYVVPISKKNYMANNSPLQNMFFIPGLTTIAQILGTGEFFHARTKIKNQTMRIKGIICGNNQQIPYSMIIQDSEKEKNKIYHNIFEYIKNHHRVHFKYYSIHSEWKDTEPPQ